MLLMVNTLVVVWVVTALLTRVLPKSIGGGEFGVTSMFGAACATPTVHITQTTTTQSPSQHLIDLIKITPTSGGSRVRRDGAHSTLASSQAAMARRRCCASTAPTSPWQVQVRQRTTAHDIAVMMSP
jgi:hypothetical protein